jgi:pimeloyl-ACP methyl ester carboxylesterase
VLVRLLRFPATDLLLPCALLASSCATVELENLSTPAPVPAGSCMTIGFMGGLDGWSDATKAARRLALDLREPAHRRYAETLENRRLDIALELVRRSLDVDRDGSLSPRERVRARWVIYGQSLGGGSATWLAWRLAELGVPVDLLLLVDSVGHWDGRIPGNVRVAAALYQDDGWLIRGESTPELVAPERTALVRVEYDYDRPPGSAISLEGLPWWKLAFRVAHSRMDRDPRVWEKARSLARAACADEKPGVRTSGPSPREDGSPRGGSAATSSRSRARTRRPARRRQP